VPAKAKSLEVTVKGTREVVLTGPDPGPTAGATAWPNYAASASGAHLAWIVETLGGQRLWYDGVVQPVTYDAIGRLRFSPDGSRLAFAAMKDKRWFVVVDGEPGPDYDFIQDGPIFSPDGSRVAYLAEKNNKWLTVVDGSPGPEYDEGSIGVFDAGRRVIFSPDNRRFAYVADEGGRECTVVDGQPGPMHEWVGLLSIAFSPDGQHVTYEAEDNNKRLTILDGRPWPTSSSVKPEAPVFSPDGKRIAYVAVKGGKEHAVVDGQYGLGYDHVQVHDLKYFRFSTAFSPDSRHLAYLLIRA
jgi:Tol biopolymer transport system component